MSAPKAKAIAETWLKVMLCSRTSSHTSFRVFRSPCWSHYTIVCHLVVSAKGFGVFTLHDWPSNGSVHTTRLSISSNGRLLCKTHARSDKANERNAMCGLMFSLKTWMWSRKEPSGSFVLFRVHVCKNQKRKSMTQAMDGSLPHFVATPVTALFLCYPDPTEYFGIWVCDSDSVCRDCLTCVFEVLIHKGDLKHYHPYC